MKKFITLLLTLVMVLSLIPMNATARSLPTNSNKAPVTPGSIGENWTTMKDIHKPKLDLTVPDGKLVFKTKEQDDDDAKRHIPHGAEDKIIGYGYDTKYHWKQCSCGCKIGMELHVDPKDAPNDTCVCGYHFSDNADLVTLWVKGCPGIKYFDKNKTEYKLNAYTYKDVKEIKISTRTHDSEATVELPKDLTLKQGENKFEVKVTAENQKVTKVYTLIINKE